MNPCQTSLMDVIILTVAVGKMQGEERARRKRKRGSTVVGEAVLGGLFDGVESSVKVLKGVEVPKLKL